MFCNLIPMLADKYHVVAPVFPGYGERSAPSVNDFEYSYERLATVTEKFTEKLNLSSYAVYLSDIGSSVGFRLAVMHPERVTAMIVQNGDAHAVHPSPQSPELSPLISSGRAHQQVTGSALPARNNPARVDPSSPHPVQADVTQGLNSH